MKTTREYYSSVYFQLKFGTNCHHPACCRQRAEYRKIRQFPDCSKDCKKGLSELTPECREKPFLVKN
ncbi:hypothetical protein A2300_02815 [Candidatus Falkowbacteria bacterium RIFOXYB2_FULL_35_7]|nr:MAG: hypothetical protein A2300_02815 [Candidatus Falkowbacteria bacterium RIFOXYB2_FULL_35_7]